MNKVRLFLATALLALASTPTVAQDAREIMIKVDNMANHSHSSAVRLMQFSTCRYRIAEGKLTCREKARVLKVESVHKGYTAEGFRDRNNKAFDVIIDPVNDKGTAMLSMGYADDKKDSDFWIYLPALAKVKRIVSVSDSNESGAVFGSEISTEDADVKKIKDYSYRLMGQEVLRGRPAWIVEMTPTEYRRTRSFYSKIVVWVDKERSVVLKEDLYDRSGRHYKQRTALNVKQIGGVWLATKGSMNNLFSKRITLWDELRTQLDIGIDDEFLSQRSLTDFAYRERLMAKYRGFIK
jgi:Outer membrane lipoprotein-sorting protein